mmetsp:Transcript_25291/g.22305  ORF Transcript_25291/g.22305 Transcript_25291/m.22305 type:complete len:265 (-) Transcript_25291:252-1046(-)
MDRVNALERDLELARKRLSYEMLNNKILSDELSMLARQNQQFAATNEALVKANKRYEEKWKKIYYSLEFYKEFYHKYIELITQKRAFNHRKAASHGKDGLNGITFKGKYNLDVDANPERAITELKRLEEDNGRRINSDILEADEGEMDDISNAHKKGIRNVMDFTREQCKVYLVNLAKGLFVSQKMNKSFRNGRDISQLGAGRTRSKSCFKDYVSDNGDILFEPETKRSRARLSRYNKPVFIYDDQNEVLLRNGYIKITFLKND